MTEPRSTSQPINHDIRNLRRSTNDRVIAGVCAGLGRYTGLDPVIFRIALGVLAVFGGAGLVLYAVAWLVVPDDTTNQSEAQRLLHGRGSLFTVVAAGIGIIGALILFDVLDRGWPGPLPAVLILAVLIALLVSRRGLGIAPAPGTAGEPGVGPDAAPHAAAPTTSAFTKAPTAGPSAPPSGAPGPLGPPAGFAPSRPAMPAYGTAGYYPPPTYNPPRYVSPYVPPAPPRAPRQPSVLAPLTLCLGVLVAGTLLALGASNALDVTAQAVFAAALLTVGIALVLGTWTGRARGLIVAGCALTVGLVVAATLSVPLRGGIGSRDDVPATAQDLHTDYHVGVGTQRLDLSQIDFAGSTRHVDATVGIGDLRVIVPPNVKLVVHAKAGSGRLDLFGIESDGTNVKRDVTFAAAQADSGPPGELDLDLRVGLGRVMLDRTDVVPAGEQQ